MTATAPRVIGRLCACLLVLVAGASLFASPGHAVTYDGRRLLVRFSPSGAQVERAAAVRSVRGDAEAQIPALGVTRVAVASPEAFTDARAAADRLSGQAGVVWAEPDAAVSADFTPNDPLYANDPYTGLGQWGIRKAAVDQAWDIVRGSPGITVATIDTGVDPGHPDLAEALLPGVTVLSQVSPGCGAPTTDDSSHGTHVAGIIAAKGNNATGIVGVAFGVRILPLKALDCTGAGASSDVAQAAIYATDHGARIINISLGAPTRSQTLQDAVDYARARNVLVVAAAGNCGQVAPECPTVNQVQYPAGFPGVLAVAATNPDDTHAPFSNQGAYVGLAAPGSRIVSTTPTYPTYLSARGATTGYAAFSGTSTATLRVTNTSSFAWPGAGAGAVRVGYRWLDATGKVVVPDGLRPLPADVPLGANVTVGVQVVAPPAIGSYLLRFDLFRDGVGPFSDQGAPTGDVVVTVTPGYGGAYAPAAAGSTLFIGMPVVLNVSVTNSGLRVWPALGPQPVHLSYHWVAADGSIAVWNGARAVLPQDLAPGASATLALVVVPPPTAGSYLLRLDLVEEGVTWFSAQGVPATDLPYTVTSGLVVSYVLGVVPTLLPGGRFGLPVTIRNEGVVTWLAAGQAPVHAAVHLYDALGKLVLWDGARTVFVSDVKPGESVSTTVIVDAPLGSGVYRVQPDLVQEGVA